MDVRSFTPLPKFLEHSLRYRRERKDLFVDIDNVSKLREGHGEVAASHANVLFAEKPRYAKVLNCHIERIEPGIE